MGNGIMGNIRLFSNLISLVFFLVLYVGLHQVFAEEWKRDHFLDRDNRFRVLWSADKEEIVFQVEVEAKGYVGLGLSQSGSMTSSDLVIGWVEDGEVHFKDRHGIGNVMPVVDLRQDWHILYGSENNTHTVLKFKRKLQTCDVEEDLEIKDEGIRLIYAYSETDPLDHNSIPYHMGKRGWKSVLLLQENIGEVPSEEGLLHWDAFGTEFALPSHHPALLWSHVLEVPNLQEKYHIVRVELLITPGNEEIVHHITLFGAVGSGFKHLVGTRGYDFTNPPKVLPPSNKYFLEFALGTGTEAMRAAPRAGVIFGKTGFKYYRMNIHYENPTHKKGVVDNSGLRIYYTPVLKPYDMGTLMAGASMNSIIPLPPKRERFVVASHDDFRCAREFIPSDGIRIVGALVHMHSTALRGSIRHFRQDKELKPIVDNVYFDLKYQNSIEFQEEPVILPGDQITVECVYNTTGRSLTTLVKNDGGTAADEMCIGGFKYYPALPNIITTSGSSRELLFNLLGNSELPSLRPQETEDFLRHFDWTTIDITNYENALRYSAREVTCTRSTGEHYKDGIISYPVNLEPYDRSNVCENRIRENTSLYSDTKIKTTEVWSSATDVQGGYLILQVVISVFMILLM